MKHNERGHEIHEGKPVALPVGFRRPPSIVEMIRSQIRTAMSQAAMENGAETFEEADDFEVGDEEELRSPYQLDDEQMNAKEEVVPKEVEDTEVKKSLPKAKPSATAGRALAKPSRRKDDKKKVIDEPPAADGGDDDLDE